jgi:hypothetical protein
MRNSTDQERTLLFSLLFANFMIAGIIGSVGGGAMQEWLHRLTGELAKAYQYTLSFSALVAVLAVIPFALIKARAPSPEEVKKAFSLSAIRRKWRLFFKLTFPHFLVGAGAGLIIPFLNLYFRTRFQLDPAQIGVFFSMLQVTMLVGVLLGPVLRDSLYADPLLHGRPDDRLLGFHPTRGLDEYGATGIHHLCDGSGGQGGSRSHQLLVDHCLDRLLGDLDPSGRDGDRGARLRAFLPGGYRSLPGLGGALLLLLLQSRAL